MRRYFIILLLFCLTANFLIKADSDIDSLRRVLNTIPSDTAKLSFYAKSLKTIVHKPHNDYSEIINFAKNGLGLAKQTKNQKRETDFTNQIGICYYYDTKYATAIVWYQDAVELSKKIKDFNAASRGYFNIGMCFNMMGKYYDALDNYLMALSLRKEAKADLLPVYTMIIVAYMHLNELEKAEVYSLEALNLEEAKELTNESLRTIVSNLAEIYVMMKDTAKAEIYYDYSIEINKQMGSKTLEASAIMEKAKLHRENKMQFALSLAQAAQIAAQTIEKNKIYSLSSLYQDISANYEDINMPATADFYLNKAIENSVNDHILAEAYMFAANLYIDRNNYQKALEMCEKALSLSIENEFNNIHSDALKCLSNIYVAQGNYRKALDINDQYDILKDSFEAISNLEKMGIQLQQNEFEQHRQAILQSQEESLNISRLRTFWIMIVFALSVLTFVVIVLNHKRKKNAYSIISSQNTQMTNLVQFKQNITDMTVDELKNPLRVIIGLSNIDNDGKHLNVIRESAKRMLDLVQNILDVNQYETDKLEINCKETNINEMIAEVMEDMATNMESKHLKFSYEALYDISVNIDRDLIRRVMDNIIANAIKFSPQGNRITIYVQQNFGEIRISISNVGQSIPLDMQEAIFAPYVHINQEGNDSTVKSTGLGLTFCKMAVAAHGGKIGVISKEGEETCFWFAIPV